jgi:hypothetical protein
MNGAQYLGSAHSFCLVGSGFPYLAEVRQQQPVIAKSARSATDQQSRIKFSYLVLWDHVDSGADCPRAFVVSSASRGMSPSHLQIKPFKSLNLFKTAHL